MKNTWCAPQTQTPPPLSLYRGPMWRMLSNTVRCVVQGLPFIKEEQVSPSFPTQQTFHTNPHNVHLPCSTTISEVMIGNLSTFSMCAVAFKEKGARLVDVNTSTSLDDFHVLRAPL